MMPPSQRSGGPAPAARSSWTRVRTRPRSAASYAAVPPGGDRYALVFAPDERRRALLDLIAGARESLRLAYYIFAADAAGAEMRDALVAACRRGVTVSLVVDGFGAGGTAEGFFAPLVDAGGSLCRFLPRYGRRYLFRNHQKMAIADGTRALIGGFNVADAYFAPLDAGGWCDLGLTIDGPAAARLADWFDALADWTHDPQAKMRTLGRIVRARSDAAGPLRWLHSGPMRRLSPMTRALKRDLQTAERLDMVAAYFSPNYGMLRRIGRIVRRGGRARVMGAALSDNSATVPAWRHCIHRMIHRGVEVREYEAGKLHMKLIVVDDVVWIGSANFDMRSLYLNLELMLRIEDAALASEARALIGRLAGDSTRVTRDLHRARGGWLQRMRWTMSYFLVATLDPALTAGMFGSTSKRSDHTPPFGLSLSKPFASS